MVRFGRRPSSRSSGNLEKRHLPCSAAIQEFKIMPSISLEKIMPFYLKISSITSCWLKLISDRTELSNGVADFHAVSRQFNRTWDSNSEYWIHALKNYDASHAAKFLSKSWICNLLHLFRHSSLDEVMKIWAISIHFISGPLSCEYLQQEYAVAVCVTRGWHFISHAILYSS